MEQNIFEGIKKINEFWQEYWSAREFYKILEYSEYNKFIPTINKAKESCKSSKNSVEDHFADVSEMVEIWSGAKREIENIYLSRFACYLIIQNADPSKESVALWQKYFAIQTRKQEIQEQYLEDSRRKYLRDEVSTHNKLLAETADKAWVKNYWTFTNYWYIWLYNWLDAKWIHSKKWLKKFQKILDHMWSEELAANLFRTTQAEAKLKRENILWEQKANQAHFEVWKEVRETIKRLWWTMPEELPATDSIINVEKRLNNEENKIEDKD